MNPETGPETPLPWHEQYPRMTLDAELFIEGERARMYSEVRGELKLSPDISDTQKSLIEELSQKDPHEINHADFARYLVFDLATHYSKFSEKRREREKGDYDEVYAERCRIYEDLLENGQEAAVWIRAIPMHDITKLPEPVVVNMLMANVSPRVTGLKVKDLLKQSRLYRPRQKPSEQ